MVHQTLQDVALAYLRRDLSGLAFWAVGIDGALLTAPFLSLNVDARGEHGLLLRPGAPRQQPAVGCGC